MLFPIRITAVQGQFYPHRAIKGSTVVCSPVIDPAPPAIQPATQIPYLKDGWPYYFNGPKKYRTFKMDQGSGYLGMIFTITATDEKDDGVRTYDLAIDYVSEWCRDAKFYFVFEGKPQADGHRARLARYYLSYQDSCSITVHGDPVVEVDRVMMYEYA